MIAERQPCAPPIRYAGRWMNRRNRAALVTLNVGERYRSLWRRYSSFAWHSYADKHRLDVIAIDQPIDSSSLARSRSPAWQKLLVLGQDFAKRYEQIVWVDSDVIINPSSPLITNGVPVERIGAVDEFSLPSRAQHSLAVDRVASANRVAAEHTWLTPKSYYESWGLPGGFDHVVQTGVLVLSQKHHREILEHVYYSYDDRGAPIWHYEMRPLSYELIRGGLVDWVDSRFNSLWIYVKAVHYPWLLEDKYPRLKRHKGGRRIANRLDEARLREPVAAALLNNYFLHFASSPYDMRAVRMVQSESWTRKALGSMLCT